MYDLEGQVEDLKLKLRAKESYIQELNGTDNSELKRQVEELKVQIKELENTNQVMKNKMTEYDRQIATTEILEESVVTKNRDLQDTIKSLTEANATWGKKIKQYVE